MTAPSFELRPPGFAAAYVAAGIKTRNEVPAELGLDPIPGGEGKANWSNIRSIMSVEETRGLDTVRSRPDGAAFLLHRQRLLRGGLGCW